MHDAAPPRLARWIVEQVAPASPYATAIVGDLLEGYRTRRATSQRNADRWYRRQAVMMLLKYGPRRALPQGLATDMSYAVRGLRRAPVFSAVVAVTLAIGIGANVAILSIVDAMYFRPLPVAHPDELVSITTGDRRRPARQYTEQSSTADFEEIRRTLGGVSGVAAYAMTDVDAGDSLTMEHPRTAFVSGNYFRVLGIAPQRGRFIQPDEEAPNGAHPVAVISDHAWRTQYRSDEQVIGRVIGVGVSRKAFTIVGVAPPHFTGLHPEGRTDLWVPYTMSDALDSTQPGGVPTRSLDVFARRLPTATLAQVQGAADATSRRLRALYPATDSTAALQVHPHEHFLNIGMSSAVMLLGMVWVVVALVHLALCMNVASLMLARIASRRVELGIRLCLGASRGRIMRQGVAEATAFALPGALLGLLTGWLLVGLVTRMQFLSAVEFRLDVRAAVVVIGVALFTILQFGLLPSLDASRTDPNAMLRDVASKARGPGRLEIVSVVQVAISVLLVADAATFASLLHRQQSIAPGYDIEHTLVIDAVMPPRVSQAEWRARHDEALSRAAALPGVVAVASADGAPLYKTHWIGELAIAGYTPPPNTPPSAIPLQAIGPGYFAALGVPLVRGREFTIHDDAGGTRHDDFDAVVVNERLARRLWPGENPLGKTVQLRFSRPSVVVGVVRDFYDVSTIAVAERAYFPLLESTNRALDVIVRARESAATTAPIIRSALGSSTPFAHATVRTLGDSREALLDISRSAAGGLSTAAGVAVALSAIGLYGLVAMWIGARRRELGIRLALGAQRVEIATLIVGGTMRIVAAGSVLGLVLSAGLVQIERGRVGPILSLSVSVIGVVIVTIVLASLIAIAAPLWRASRDMPATMLR